MERPTSPEVSYEHSTEAVLNRIALETLRAEQKALYDPRHDRLAGIDDEDALFDEMDMSVDEYLTKNSIDEEHPYYDTLRRSVRNMSYDRISNSRWEYGEWANPDADAEERVLKPGSSGIDKLERMQEILLGHRLDNTDDTNTDSIDNSDDEYANLDIEQLRDEVEKTREAWAARTAKRSSKLFGKKKDVDEGLERYYHARVNELGRVELADQLSDDEMSDEDKNIVVVSYLFAEQEKLRKLTTKNINGTPVGKFVEFMNKGTKWERIRRGIFVGAGAAVFGSVLAGAAGAGAIAAGTVFAAKFARGYAHHDKRGISKAEDRFNEGSVAEAVNNEQAVLPEDEREDRFDTANRHFSYLLEDDTKDQQKKRWKAVAVGAGSVAVGSTLGYGGFFLISQASQIINGPDFQWKHPFGHIDPTPGLKDGELPNVVDKPDTIEGEILEAKPKLDWNDFAQEARLVESGEGWYQTFEDMGIPKEHWADVLEDAGPKLAEQDLSYFDDASGEWRISQPGRLPASALRTIADASKRDGFTLVA